MFGNAAGIAEAVCFLASGRARFITGQKPDAGQVQLHPAKNSNLF
jgi:hypothetical protein